MIRNNKILLLVDNIEIVNDLSSESNLTFLFPIESFSVGYHEFKLNDIKVDNAYIFVNRLLDKEGIKEFRELLDQIPANIKGIVFDDVGILNILQETNSNLTKILFLNHHNCSYATINAWLEYVDSVIPSTDITESEVNEILAHTIKPLTLYTFGYMNIMYSRRLLLTNYNKHFNKNVSSISRIHEAGTNQDFKIVENKYGTVIYPNKPFNGLNYLGKEPTLFYLINTAFLSITEVKQILYTNEDLLDIYPYRYLSDKPTTYKVKDGKND